MSSDMKSSAHCASVAAAAHPRAHLIMKYFQCSNCDLLVRAFKVYVRPLLESCHPRMEPLPLERRMYRESAENVHKTSLSTGGCCKRGLSPAPIPAESRLPGASEAEI